MTEYERGLRDAAYLVDARYWDINPETPREIVQAILDWADSPKTSDIFSPRELLLYKIDMANVKTLNHRGR